MTEAPARRALVLSTLAGIVAVAALLYAWRAGSYLEIYYAAAVRSMSMNWHDFVFGAFDPAGTISLDKLPGAFWVQALSVRLFGLHTWTIIMPQVVEGSLTVAVLYRAVRRTNGPAAGLVAASALVISPAAVTLDRGNIPDTLLVLLIVLAANSAISALVTGHVRHLVLAGALVGLAFQAKMLEAWFVLPALGLVYLVAGRGGMWRRLLSVGAMTFAAIVVSLSWMAFVTATPASHRPYVDGSHDNSVFQQVFVYNGFGRFDEATPDQLLSSSIGLNLGNGVSPPPSWNRLLSGADGRDAGWLVPAALIALVAGLFSRRKETRLDLVRAGFLLFGAWLVTFFVVFSITSALNSYYTAALAPPVAGLIGSGVALAWARRDRTAARLTVAGATVVTAVYAACLLPSFGTGLPGWLRPLTLALGAAAALVVVASLWSKRSPELASLAVLLAVAAGGLVPAVASESAAANRLGPFDTPFQPVVVSSYIRHFFGDEETVVKTLPTLEHVRNGARYLMATETSALAAPFIFYSGLEVLPIGGFTGTIPSPSLHEIEALVRHNVFHLVLQSPTTSDPRLRWIARHCLDVGRRTAPSSSGPSLRLAVYYCLDTS
ncbi:MAG: glycosyltransferase family 39 protein [Acidimicrobiales bacterium]